MDFGGEPAIEIGKRILRLIKKARHALGKALKLALNTLSGADHGLHDIVLETAEARLDLLGRSGNSTLYVREYLFPLLRDHVQGLLAKGYGCISNLLGFIHCKLYRILNSNTHRL
ncbi:hypothetical protein D3C73_1418540 [compost metagenome]